MKRTLSLLLAAILVLSFGAGCANGRAPAPSQAASVPANAEEEVADDAPQLDIESGAVSPGSPADAAVQGSPSDADAPGSPSDAGAPGSPSDADVILDPAQTSFPGGLDDDGRGPEEEEIFDESGASGLSGLTPVEFIALDGGKQYEANIFLSNFAEQGANLYFYDLDTSQILPSLVRFAHIWCKINDRSAITYSQLDGGTYEVLSLEKFQEVIGRFIPLNVTMESVEYSYPPQAHSFYQDGCFFFEAADGEAYNRIAVADSLALLDDGRYVLTFTEYEIDLDAYYSFETGIPRSYYELSPFDASQHPYLTRIRDGYAIVTPYQYNGRSTYQLVEYTTW